MILQQEMKKIEREMGTVHSCSGCPNFNVFNQGLCYWCKMGQDKVPRWKLTLPREILKSTKTERNN